MRMEKNSKFCINVDWLTKVFSRGTHEYLDKTKNKKIVSEVTNEPVNQSTHAIEYVKQMSILCERNESM